MSVTIAVLARHPFGAQVKTRLSDRLDAATRAGLYCAFLRDTLRQVAAVSNVSCTLVYTPREARAWFRELTGSSWQLIPQRDAGFGARIAGAFEDLFSEHAHVLLVGSDAPNVPRAYFERGVRALERGADVVLGPAADGGYYCIGLGRAQPGLFDAVEWSSPRTRARTKAAAAVRGLHVHELPPWYDVDVAPDLRRLSCALRRDPTAAPHTWHFMCGSTACQRLAIFGHGERERDE
ncbi:MAG TPA: TIGR04282 family arsenosugar biosynthesis glycosyltransferase [Polyangiales bacterium]|nr:TIGR04282 family arsenosugar biosynthesis glycosyltransferase [Polyangiales bacterium]